MDASQALPPHFWLLLAACLVAFALLWWFAPGALQLARQWRLRQRIDALAPGAGPPDEAALAAMRQAMTQARDARSAGAARLNASDAADDKPWLIFIGDAEANVPSLLTAAGGTPLPPPGEVPTAPFWHLWLMPALTAVEPGPGIVDDLPGAAARRLWYEALFMLARRRDHGLPLDGIALCIGAQGLLGGPDTIGPLAARLRSRMDEATRLLRIHLPVHLIVTGLERLEGYDAVRSMLPPQVLDQALGYCLPVPAAPGEPAGKAAGRVDELYTPLAGRLHALRLTLLRDADAPAARLAIHAFVEQLHALQPGLRVLAESLFEDRRAIRGAHWRGLYLTAAGQGAAAAPGEADASRREGAFVCDLFQRLLPRDAPLAH